MINPVYPLAKSSVKGKISGFAAENAERAEMSGYKRGKAKTTIPPPPT
jgi:hypothetical protein